MPRTTPYTARGIRRVPCSKCGAPSYARWNICADKVRGRTRYRGLCAEHDIELNAMVMRWVWGDGREADIANYAAGVREQSSGR